MRSWPPMLLGLAGAFALAGVLLGCGGGNGDDGGVASGSTVSAVEPTDPPATARLATDAPATDPPATDPPATDPTVTAAPTTAAPSADEGECLIGDWMVTEEQMDGYYAGLMSTLEAPLTMDTAGVALLSFGADGTYTWAPQFELTVEVAGQSGIGDVSGTITGNWTAVDGIVSAFSDVNAVAVSISVNGVTFDGDDLANGLLNSSPVNGVTYSCDGSTPVLDFQTADPTVTVPVTLTPA